MLAIIIKVKGDDISHKVVADTFLFADLIEWAMFENFGMDTVTEDMVDVYIPESDSRYKLIYIHEAFKLDDVGERGTTSAAGVEAIGFAIMNGKNKTPKTEQYYINTGMGKMFQDRSKLPFLTEVELDELDSIGYSGATLDGKKNDRETYLNSLDKGTFIVSCTRTDNGDFSQTHLIIRTI